MVLGLVGPSSMDRRRWTMGAGPWSLDHWTMVLGLVGPSLMDQGRVHFAFCAECGINVDHPAGLD